jgi:hypothetical protein
MAINFSAQFIVNEKTSTRVLRLTDTSTGFTLSKGNFLITFPDGTKVANTDFVSPQISAPGGSINISLITDIDNTVLTGAYVISYVVLDVSLNEYNKTESFDFNWEKPTKVIIDDSDVVLPEVQFKDLTAYETSGSFTGTLTRNFYTTTPSTSEVGAITKTSVGDILTPSNASKYYEGIYLVKSDISVAYTHTSKSWLTVAYTDLLEETFDVREAPTQDELVTLMNTYKDQIEAYKSTNPSQYEIMNEQYDLVLALYSHIIARYQTTTLDGSKAILDQLLGLLPPTNPYTYKATQMLPFAINFTTSLTGSGTTGTIPKFTGVASLGDSIIKEDTGRIGIGKIPATTLDVNGFIQGTSIVKSGGTSSQFLKADGSVDTSTYLTTGTATTTYVPYTGANANVNLGEKGLTAGYLGFDLTPTATPTGIGTTYWDSFYRTLSLIDGDGDTTLQIGQEQRVLVHNNTGSTLTDGQVVYVSGSTGELPSVALASNASESASSVTFGIVTESIAHGANGFITTNGIIHGLNTNAFDEGAAIYLGSTAGTFTQTKPIAPANSVLVGYIIKKSGGNGSIFVKIQNGYELDELHNVLLTSKANNDGLFYESATGLWKNKTIAAILGYTPEPSITAGTIFQYYRGDKTFQTLNTTAVTEATNLYYTESRVSANTDVAANTAVRHNAVTIGTANGLSLSTQVLSLGLASSSANGALSSTDWTTFNSKQVAGDYITALTGEATASGPGSSAITLLTSAVTGKLLTGLNLTPGGSIAATDSILAAFGKVQNQISAMIGGVMYNGIWNASTNSPSLTSSVGTKGLYYIVSVAGSTNLDGINDWKVGDWAIFNGTTWNKVDNTDAVSSVNGYTGAVSLVSSDITEGLTNLYYTNSRARGSISLTVSGSSGASTYDSATGVLNVPTYTLSGLGGQTALNGTGFVKISGTTISYDNSTYLTTSAAASTYLALAGGTLTGALNGTSATFTGDLTLSATNPRLYFTDTDNNPDYFISNTDGTFTIYDVTNSQSRFTIGTTGNGTFGGNLTVGQIIRSGGTSAQFLKADGSIDSSTYLTTSSASSTYLPLAGGTLTGAVTGTRLVLSQNSADITLSIGNAGTGRAFSVLGTSYFSADIQLGYATNSILKTTALGFITSAIAGTDYQAPLSGTGFVKISGSTISYDNSTYLTTASASSTYLTIATASSTYLPLAGGTLTGALSGTSALFSSSVRANNPSEGATGEGLIAGQSFKIDGTGTSQKAVMYMVSNVLSDTYASGLTAQFGNFAGDKGFGFNLNTSGGYELYVKNTTWNKAITVANTGAVTLTSALSGTNATFSGKATANVIHSSNGSDSDSGNFTGFIIGGSNAANARTASIIKNTSGNYDLIIRSQNATSVTTGSIIFQNGSTNHLTIASTGAATFNNTLTASGIIYANGGINMGSNAVKMRWSNNNTPTLGFPFGDYGTALHIEVSDNDTGGLVISNDGTTVYGAGDSGFVFRVIDEDSYQGNNNIEATTCFKVNQGAGGGGYIKGDFTATGDIIAYSDIRVKENIKPLTSALSKVLELNGYYYNRTDLKDKSTKIGFIAQEVQSVIPELVTYDSLQDRYAVSYGNATALLVEAIKEQQTQIQELKELLNQFIK